MIRTPRLGERAPTYQKADAAERRLRTVRPKSDPLGSRGVFASRLGLFVGLDKLEKLPWN